MTDANDEALDPELAAIYAAEQRVTTATIEAAGIARDRLLVAALARAAKVAAETPRPRSVARKRLLIAAAAAVCISLGYAAGRLSAPAAPPPPASAPAAATPVAIDAGVPDAMIDAAVDASIDAAAAPRPTAHPTAPESREALLIDQARAALRRHLPTDALAALQHHAREFPTGQLREDRDVLLIEVALAQDRRADANELIATYFERYPAGGLRSRVEALQGKLDESLRRR